MKNLVLSIIFLVNIIVVFSRCHANDNPNSQLTEGELYSTFTDSTVVNHPEAVTIDNVLSFSQEGDVISGPKPDAFNVTSISEDDFNS